MSAGFSARIARWAAHPGLVPAAFLAGILFLFVPGQVYAPNEAAFAFSLRQMALVLVPAFLVAFALLSALASLGGPRARRIAACVLTALGIAAWITAAFFRASQGELNGVTELKFASFSGVGQLLLYIVIGAIAGVLAWRFAATVRRLLVALFVVLLAQWMWSMVEDSQPWYPAPQIERLARLSPERNVVVILLDAFQGDFIPELGRADPKLLQAFDGFTWFSNATSHAPSTYVSLPSIHSGTAVVAGNGIRSVYEAAVANGSFIAQLAAAGYDAVEVNPILGVCPRGATCQVGNALVYGQAVAVADNAAFLESLALFRALPRILQPFIYNRGRWRTPWHLKTIYAQTSDELLERVSRELHTTSGAPAMRFLHLMSSHAPAMLDASCRPIEGVAWSRSSALAQDHCALDRVAGFLEALRRAKVYDATAIVIMADHGSGLPANGFELGALASPLLMVKPFAAHGALTTSERPAGLVDVGATVCAIAQACRTQPPGMNVLDPATADVPRTFPFVTYEWHAGYFGAKSLPFTDRFDVRGPPREMGSWRRVTHMPAPTRELQFQASDPQGSYGFGWSAFETTEGRTVRWAVGDAADLYLDLGPAQDERIAFDVRSHHAGEEVTLEVNGATIGRFPVTTSWSRQELLVPKARMAQGPDRIVLRFSLSNPVGADPRPLAVLFDRLTVTPAS